MRDVAASVVRPVKELKGFEKITLQPGERTTVSFAIGKDALSFETAGGQRRVEPGRFVVFVGTDSTTENAAAFDCR